MKQWVLSLFAVLMIGLLVFAADKKTDDVNVKLKGIWTVVAVEEGGKKAPDEDVRDRGQTMTFDGKIFTNDGVTPKLSGTYKIDVSKTPAELDVTFTEGPAKSVAKWIFQLNGDTLKIAAKGKKSEDRPKSFDDKDIAVVTLSRKK